MKKIKLILVLLVLFQFLFPVETIKVGVVLVEFSDFTHEISYNTTDFEKMMFSTNGTWFDTIPQNGT